MDAPWISEALIRLADMGVPEKEIKSKHTCFLYVENEWPSICLDGLIYDWNRIYNVLCCE